jgi:hypothetical protein
MPQLLHEQKPQTAPIGESQATAVLPRIEYDPALTELAKVEVDGGYFTELMASKGLSATDIAETTFRISADEVIERDSPSDDIGDALVEFGHYNRQSQAIQLNIGSIKAAVEYIQKTSPKGDPTDSAAANRLASKLASKSGLHELGHRVESDHDTFEEDLAYYADVLPDKFLARAIRKVRLIRKGHRSGEVADLMRKVEIAESQAFENPAQEHYDNEPKELRADKFRDEAMEQLPKGYFPIQVTLAVQALDAESVS